MGGCRIFSIMVKSLKTSCDGPPSAEQNHKELQGIAYVTMCSSTISKQSKKLCLGGEEVGGFTLTNSSFSYHLSFLILRW